MISNSIKDEFGRSYILIRKAHATSHLEATNPIGRGADPVFVKSFVNRLRAPVSYWQRLVFEHGLPQGHTKSAVELICEQVARGRLQFAEVTRVEQTQSANRTIGKTSRNKMVELALPLAESVTRRADESKQKSFYSHEAALQYLASANIDIKHVSKVMEKMGLAAKAPPTTVTEASGAGPELAAVVNALVTGELLLFEKEPPSTPPTPKDPAPEELAPAPRQASLGPHELGNPATTFVEIQLLDDQGEPIADEAYQITDPDGVVHEGKTNAKGSAKVSGIRRGNCQVVFPNIDGNGISAA